MKQQIIADIHTHSIMSGHAFGTVREMAMGAKENDIQLLGITDHAPGIPGTCDPFYFYNCKIAPRHLYGVELIHGAEVNVLTGGKLSLDECFMKCLDYAIVGIHKECYVDEGIDKNTDNLIACMKHPKVFFVSHPDDGYTPLNYEHLVKAAKEYNVALEVNNSSLIKTDRLNCRENISKMLQLCMEHRVPIILSSDAHDPDWVGEVTKAIEFVDNFGFDEDLILNNSIEKIKEFIGYDESKLWKKG
jgi:putative hydrolase